MKNIALCIITLLSFSTCANESIRLPSGFVDLNLELKNPKLGEEERKLYNKVLSAFDENLVEGDRVVGTYLRKVAHKKYDTLFVVEFETDDSSEAELLESVFNPLDSTIVKMGGPKQDFVIHKIGELFRVDLDISFVSLNEKAMVSYLTLKRNNNTQILVTIMAIDTYSLGFDELLKIIIPNHSVNFESTKKIPLELR